MTSPDSRGPSLTRRAFVQGTVCAGAIGLVAAAEEKPSAPAFLAGSDWPMYRHDSALSATSPIRGGLAEAPRVAWSLDLGGPRVPSEAVVVRDVTGDGRPKVLVAAEDGRLYCLKGNGARRHSPFFRSRKTMLDGLPTGT